MPGLIKKEVSLTVLRLQLVGTDPGTKPTSVPHEIHCELQVTGDVAEHGLITPEEATLAFATSRRKADSINSPHRQNVDRGDRTVQTVATWTFGPEHLRLPIRYQELLQLWRQPEPFVRPDSARRAVGQTPKKSRVGQGCAAGPSKEPALPEAMGRELRANLAKLLRRTDSLWIEFTESAGYLPLLPWEKMLHDYLPTVPILRLSPHEVKALFFERPLSVALCVSTPFVRWPHSTQTIAKLMEQLRRCLPEYSTIHVFADDLARRTCIKAAVQLGHTEFITVHDSPGRPRGRTTLSEVDPWREWILQALRGTAVDIIHFVVPGMLFPDRPRIVTSCGPSRKVSARAAAQDVPRKGRGLRFFSPLELTHFLNVLGSWATVLSVPVQGRCLAQSRMSLRLVADQISRLRPGVAVVHDFQTDPNCKTLAETYRFLLDHSPAEAPVSASVCLYCHPAQAEATDTEPASMPKKLRQQYQRVQNTLTQQERAREGRVPGWIAATQRVVEQAVSRLVLEPATASDSSICGLTTALKDIVETIFEKAPSLTPPPPPPPVAIPGTRAVFVVTGMDFGGERVNLLRIDEAFGDPTSPEQFPLKCTPDDEAFQQLRATPPGVRRAGQTLYDALIAYFPVRQVLANMAQKTTETAHPLFFRVDTPDAERLPWEILCDSNNPFMALDPQGRWPIARLALPRRPTQPLERVITSELRLAIVLGAARESGVNEWTRIAKSIARFRTPVDLLLLTSEEDAIAAVDETASQWLKEDLPHKVRGGYIGDDADTLVRHVRAHLPNIVHFFCHGNAEITPLLELEHRADRTAKRDRGSIRLGSAHLIDIASRKSLWLIVLNCCQGARPAPQLNSFAKELVAEGTPAVIAMRESVDVSDANVFSEHLYEQLLQTLQALFTRISESRSRHPVPFDELDWLRAVNYARQKLVGNGSPDCSAAWTYPVLYVHRYKLALYPLDSQALFSDQHSALRAELESIKHMHPRSEDQRLELTTRRDLLRELHTTLAYYENDPEAVAHCNQLSAKIRDLEQLIAQQLADSRENGGRAPIARRGQNVPRHLSCNAWTGVGKVEGRVSDPTEWALHREMEAAPRLLAPPDVDLRKWQDERVGWGVVLADGAAIPPPIEQLIAERKAPVLRYMRHWEHEFSLLRNYQAAKDISVTGAPHGTAQDALPFYLLIVGSPEEVPWRMQYVLSANRCVGRLHLTGRPLENYVNALLTEKWSAHAESNPHHAVVLAVDQGAGDITHLMRNAIAAPLAAGLQEDGQIGSGALFLDDSIKRWSMKDLATTLSSHQPGLIVTTSHGVTAPLNDSAAMARNLGLPVDSQGTALQPQVLLENWQPGGAIWYAHACCSAGSDSESSFADLFSRDSPAGKVLAAVAALGDRVAPLPTELLGAESPVRAFVGHVEPTFDWTLQEPFTGQFLTANIVDALYGSMYVKKGTVERPVGYAFREWHLQASGLRAEYEASIRRFNAGEDAGGVLFALQLATRDIESTVILGDPAVAMPGLD